MRPKLNACSTAPPTVLVRANFFERYVPIADGWRLYDAAPPGGPELIATGQSSRRRRILNRDLWEQASQGV